VRPTYKEVESETGTRVFEETGGGARGFAVKKKNGGRQERKKG